MMLINFAVVRGQSVVVEGDVVHILFTESVDGHFTLDNNKVQY